MLTFLSSGSLFCLWVCAALLVNPSSFDPVKSDDLPPNLMLLIVFAMVSKIYELMTFGALRSRVSLIEEAFGRHLGSKWIWFAMLLDVVPRCFWVVVRSLAAQPQVEEVPFILACCDVVAWIMVAWVVAWSLTAVMITASSPLTGCSSQYVLAEATWAQQVIGRTRIASIIPPFVSSLLVLYGYVLNCHQLGLSLAVVPLWAGVAVLDICSLLVLVGYFKSSPLPVLRSERRQGGLTRTLTIVCGDPSWRAKVSELAHRSMTVGALFDFYCKLGAGGEIMPHFDPRCHTTNDVVRSAIVPLSRLEGGGGLAYASMGAAVCGKLPECLVTHDWRNLFVHLVAAVVADALGREQYHKVAADLAAGRVDKLRYQVEAAGSMERRYWVCAFCVNQHASICSDFGRPPANDPNGAARWEANCHDSLTSEKLPRCSCGEPKHFNDSPALCELNKFDDMMDFLVESVPGFRQLVAVDRNFDIFTRLWCIAELVQASLSAIPQTVCLLSDEVLDMDNADLSIYIKLANLKATECCATRPEDKAAIMAKIPDVHEFDAQLQALIFGTRGLLAKRLVGTDVLYAAVRAAVRISAISKVT
eukprot:CAMPEP_0203892852 /NCGR_PEP_ID=MMETSP0359-20131031/35989_1 /ASSEMBLY_ACC=CAM_ASM_000338 /TAXON_ID=268821 /ORGANISM="Scrippsiella Hangoei, Strain SHTV-5" /LENGTH=588 /DNA_ID=CAMNT_0050814887 /DNA_START=59 /DNA_END=1822 /DNA_ORIENTATION=-